MKKQLLVLAAVLVILGCLVASIAVSNRREASVDPATKSSQKQLKKAQDALRQHDAVNQNAIKSAGDQIILLNQQKAQLCAQVKNARLANPLCP